MRYADHQVTLLLRAEVNALMALSFERGLVIHDEWEWQLVIEARRDSGAGALCGGS